MHQTTPDIDYRTPHPVPSPRPVVFPAQVSQPLRYGFDSLRRFATE